MHNALEQVEGSTVHLAILMVTAVLLLMEEPSAILNQATAQLSFLQHINRTILYVLMIQTCVEQTQLHRHRSC